MSQSPQHYFSPDPAAKSSPRVIEYELDGRGYSFLSDAGVFSGREVDPGTRILLEVAPLPDQPAGMDVLDLGCGYGPIAITLAARLPAAHIWAVDVNTRAIELTSVNAAAAGLTNVSAGTADDVPAEIRLGAIYSNPPIRIGKPALRNLLDAWLPRLATDGFACLVVAKNLGADSLARWLAEERGYLVQRLDSHKGYRILRVSH